MQAVNYKCKQGETFRRVLRFTKKSDGTPINITGWVFRMDFRADAASVVAGSATITARDNSIDPGAADLVIAASVTAALAPQTYKFDCCADASSERKFYLFGDLEIEETMTRG